MTPARTVTLVSALKPMASSTLVMLLGMVKPLRLKWTAVGNSPTVVTPPPIEIFVKLAQLANAPSPMVRTLSGIVKAGQIGVVLECVGSDAGNRETIHRAGDCPGRLPGPRRR